MRVTDGIRVELDGGEVAEAIIGAARRMLEQAGHANIPPDARLHEGVGDGKIVVFRRHHESTEEASS